MASPKIEKVKASITKTKAAIVEHQTKLRELERQKIQLENEEIVAMFRREKLNEDEFAELLRGNTKNGRAKGNIHAKNAAQTLPEEISTKDVNDSSDGSFGSLSDDKSFTHSTRREGFDDGSI